MIEDKSTGDSSVVEAQGFKIFSSEMEDGTSVMRSRSQKYETIRARPAVSRAFRTAP
jgi:hypothetical protein